MLFFGLKPRKYFPGRMPGSPIAECSGLYLLLGSAIAECSSLFLVPTRAIAERSRLFRLLGRPFAECSSVFQCPSWKIFLCKNGSRGRRRAFADLSGGERAASCSIVARDSVAGLRNDIPATEWRATIVLFRFLAVFSG
jgi:hypothetical protein